MIKCCESCTPICDFCIWAVHEELYDDDMLIKGAPIACDLWPDERHNNIAQMDGGCWDFHCVRATPKEHIFIPEPEEEDEPEDSPEKERTRAERRKKDWAKALRKQGIAHNYYGWWEGWYRNLHQYSKGKIHCSCPMCRAKTSKTKMRKSWGPGGKNWPMRDKKRLDEMSSQEEEQGETNDNRS